LLLSLVLLGIVLGIGLISSKETISTSLTQFRNISDNEIFEAAKTYAISENLSFNNGYTCIHVSELIDLGYLKKTNNQEIKSKIIKITKNNNTKVIESIKYTQVCNEN